MRHRALAVRVYEVKNVCFGLLQRRVVMEFLREPFLYLRAQPPTGSVSLRKDSALHPSKDRRAVYTDNSQNVRRAHPLIQVRESFNGRTRRRFLLTRWSRSGAFGRVKSKSQLLRAVARITFAAASEPAVLGESCDPSRNQGVRRLRRSIRGPIRRVRKSLESGWARRGAHRVPGLAEIRESDGPGDKMQRCWCNA